MIFIVVGRFAIDEHTDEPLGTAVAASAATTALAAAASAAARVSFADNTGASIPTAGFAQLTLAFSLVGVALAAVLARTARTPPPRAADLTAIALAPGAKPGRAAARAQTEPARGSRAGIPAFAGPSAKFATHRYFSLLMPTGRVAAYRWGTASQTG
jgi:hypothetical protein